MKSFTKLILLISSVLSISLQAIPESYPMICKGGSGMYGPVDSITVNGLYSARVTLTFKRGQIPRNPASGECVWLDRAIRSDEPNRMTYNWPGAQKLIVTHSGIVGGEGPLKYLIDGLVGQKYFYVRAYRSGDLFNVTKLGP